MSYVPERGDFVWLNFDPQSGHEQAVHRPALVLSPRDYNRKVGLALFCPVSSKEKGYPFEVKISSGRKITGVILADQIKSLDWRARRATFVERAANAVITEALAKGVALLE